MRALSEAEQGILTRLSALLGEPTPGVSPSPAARKEPLEMPRLLHGEPGGEMGIGDFDWGESPLVRPLGVDTEQILRTLPRDDRGQAFDPVLAAENSYYAQRHKKTWGFYIHAVEDAKRAVAQSLIREAEHKRLEERMEYLKNKAVAEKKAAEEKRQRQLEAGAEQWKPRHLRG